MARKKETQNPPRTETYRHPTAESLLQPDVGIQAQFRRKKPRANYRYDSSLDPSMSWDEGNAKMKNSTSLAMFLAHRMAFYGDQSRPGLFKTRLILRHIPKRQFIV